MIRQATARLPIRAVRPGLHDCTREIASWLTAQDADHGLLTLFCAHSSASLLIQENAAPAARADLENYFARLAPRSGAYAHDDEGPDDMPAHLRTALTQTSIAIPVIDRRMALGRWQGIYLFEHRDSCPQRTIALHLIGD